MDVFVAPATKTPRSSTLHAVSLDQTDSRTLIAGKRTFEPSRIMDGLCLSGESTMRTFLRNLPTSYRLFESRCSRTTRTFVLFLGLSLPLDVTFIYCAADA